MESYGDDLTVDSLPFHSTDKIYECGLTIYYLHSITLLKP